MLLLSVTHFCAEFIRFRNLCAYRSLFHWLLASLRWSSINISICADICYLRIPACAFVCTAIEMCSFSKFLKQISAFTPENLLGKRYDDFLDCIKLWFKRTKLWRGINLGCEAQFVYMSNVSSLLPSRYSVRILKLRGFEYVRALLSVVWGATCWGTYSREFTTLIDCHNVMYSRFSP